MKIPQWLRTYGDLSFRGASHKEDYVLSSLIDDIRRNYPDTYGLLAFHPKNEGKRTASQSRVDKMKGLTKGVCDLVIPGNPTLFLEIKIQDHTKASWSNPEQLAFLKAAHDAGAYVCLAFGYEASIRCFNDWIQLNIKNASKCE